MMLLQIVAIKYKKIGTLFLSIFSSHRLRWGVSMGPFSFNVLMQLIDLATSRNYILYYMQCQVFPRNNRVALSISNGDIEGSRS